MLIRTFAGVLAFTLMLAAAGCGDDEEAGDADVATAPVVTTDRVQTAEIPEPETGPGTGDATSPEDQPGGAGDEEPARSEVVLELSRRGLSPERVQVAPFIAVNLIVRSDGTEYDLTVSGPTSGGGAAGSSEADLDLDGLRPGQEYEVVERNTDSRAVIVASDEVGP